MHDPHPNHYHHYNYYIHIQDQTHAFPSQTAKGFMASVATGTTSAPFTNYSTAKPPPPSGDMNSLSHLQLHYALQRKLKESADDHLTGVFESLSVLKDACLNTTNILHNHYFGNESNQLSIAYPSLFLASPISQGMSSPSVPLSPSAVFQPDEIVNALRYCSAALKETIVIINLMASLTNPVPNCNSHAALTLMSITPNAHVSSASSSIQLSTLMSKVIAQFRDIKRSILREILSYSSSSTEDQPTMSPPTTINLEIVFTQFNTLEETLADLVAKVRKVWSSSHIPTRNSHQANNLGSLIELARSLQNSYGPLLLDCGRQIKSASIQNSYLQLHSANEAAPLPSQSGYGSSELDATLQHCVNSTSKFLTLCDSFFSSLELIRQQIDTAAGDSSHRRHSKKSVMNDDLFNYAAEDIASYTIKMASASQRFIKVNTCINGIDWVV
jgi:hypothetical protein